jgi:hypothetical protein
VQVLRLNHNTKCRTLASEDLSTEPSQVFHRYVLSVCGLHQLECNVFLDWDVTGVPSSAG